MLLSYASRVAKRIEEVIKPSIKVIEGDKYNTRQMLTKKMVIKVGEVYKEERHIIAW